MAKKLKPVHPGEILREEFMATLGLSMNRHDRSCSSSLSVPFGRFATTKHPARSSPLRLRNHAGCGGYARRRLGLACSCADHAFP
jgi:hypothetical protein